MQIEFDERDLDTISYFYPEAKLVSKTIGSEELKQQAKLLAAMPEPTYEGDEIDGQDVISYVARVSNPKNQLNFDTAAGLLRYCIKH